MSIPSKDTIWGYLKYKGKSYGVLSAPITDELRERINRCNQEKELLPYTSAPWRYKKEWSLEDGKLYLTKLYSEEFHKEVFGTIEKVFADWVDRMEILIEDRRICKTYQHQGEYLHEIRYIELNFDKGVLIDSYEKSELYTRIDLVNYIERNDRITTLRIDITELLAYLWDDRRPPNDLLWLRIEETIELMISKKEKGGSSVSREKLIDIFKFGDSAVVAHLRGNDIEQMIDSLIDTVTDEVIQIKGYALHIMTGIENSEKVFEQVLNKVHHKIAKDRGIEVMMVKSIEENIRNGELILRAIIGI
ncbi:hypothetical protein [Nitratifractor salsuginis]|uniref:Uncharacterized protein n=1 Tax=Nitratifractor salsuginis (strain DSM 16511 / JCM 12458 / E9I37-1) TaxID=749222 RepID=E6X337_NITSE|nr:hypothetical protein [Nitratifractor salsuginis]ADV46181.1 hypothetical protein Nitsa_0921 [Nitratifractor salsuginis DSM 16511]